MAETVVSIVVNVLVEKLYSAALMSFAGSEGIDTQLETWKRKLPLIHAVLADAGQKEGTQKAVELWLLELQHLAYDIDDVLDDIATEVIKRKLNQKESHAGQKRKWSQEISSSFTRFMYGREISSKLENITQRLNVLFEQKKDLGLNMNVNVVKVERSNIRSQQTSSVNVSKVLGREEEDKRALIGKLLLGNEEASSNQNLISVVSIVGMGGLGKTTLAQLLYNDKKVKDHFELRAWVCVSNDFDVFSISKQIYQAVGGDNKEFANLDLLHVALKEKLVKKRFLVVLDDVWNEDHKKWDLLRSAFDVDVGAHGSKFLVTTRKKEVALVMDSLQPYMMKVLSNETSMSLLAQSALGELNFDGHPSLKLIAQGIVRKCDGLPLALIALGRVLKIKGNKEVEWKELLNSNIWNSHDKSDILPALKLSYYDLPAHLKQVFAYCSLFPKDYEFEKKKLVLKWMAQGFLSQPKGKYQPMESLGSKYFEELLSRSFFQPLGNDESRYIMHDLINELATSVAGEFFFRLDDNMDLDGDNEAYEKFRHFSFTSHERVAECKELKELHRARLRTFLPVTIRWRKINTLDNVIVELLPHLHFLRVLSLTHWSITKVPQSIGNLKHLRYLNFSYTDIEQIPEQVSEIYNLQSLLVRDCYMLSSLPVSFAKLINLRHLDNSYTKLTKLPLGFGGLTSLQTLSEVIIDVDNTFKISELKGLKDLQGELSIVGLQNVIDPTEAEDANLQEKNGLDDLKLIWGDASRNTSSEDDIIEKLRPHSKLKKLGIYAYRGMKFPSWLGDTSFDHLTHLELYECDKCRELPTLEHLTSLRHVTLTECDSLESYRCPDSVEWLDIFYCSSMTSLRFSKLQENLSSSSSSSSSNMKYLQVKDCNSIKSISQEHLQSLTSLHEMWIEKCPSMEDSFPSHGLWPPNLKGLNNRRTKEANVKMGNSKLPTFTC